MKNIYIKLKTYIDTIVSKIGDKKAHLICSFIITFIIGLINLIAGIVIGCVVGIAKEIYDEFKYKKYREGIGFDRTNLMYDTIGIIVAIILLLII